MWSERERDSVTAAAAAGAAAAVAAAAAAGAAAPCTIIPREEINQTQHAARKRLI